MLSAKYCDHNVLQLVGVSESVCHILNTFSHKVVRQQFLGETGNIIRVCWKF